MRLFVALELGIGIACAASCAKSEPPPFTPHPLAIEGMPVCRGVGNGYRHPILVKAVESDRGRTTKQIFFNAPEPDDDPLTVDRSKHRVEVVLGTCAEEFTATGGRYDCAAATVAWYATIPVEVDPARPTAIAFQTPPKPIECLRGQPASR